jgi:hypothetical protein
LVVWLRTVYNGTNRSFFIGDWEMGAGRLVIILKPKSCAFATAGCGSAIAWVNNGCGLMR